MVKRIAMVVGLLVIALTATGCGSYPSDAEQTKALEDKGFYDCRISTSSGFFDNTSGSCKYTGRDGEVCTAGKVIIMDDQNKVSLKRITCEKVDK